MRFVKFVFLMFQMKPIRTLFLITFLTLFASAIHAEADLTKIYTIRDTVDYTPRFPGGDSIMRAFIAERIGSHSLKGHDKPFFCTFVISPFGEIDHGSIKCLRRADDGSLADSRPYSAYENAVREAIKDIPGFVAAEVDLERVYYQYMIPFNCTLEGLADTDTPLPTATAAGRPDPTYTAGTRKSMSRADGIYTRWDRIDRRPEFPGGTKALYKALNANLDRPHVYSHQKHIFCSFVILANGDIDPSTIKCVRKVDGHFADVPEGQYTTWEKRVMDSVAKLPGFRPARHNGKDVPYEYILPLNFGKQPRTRP